MLHYNNLELTDIDGEIWENAFGLDGLYEVSNKGRVKSLERTVFQRNGRTRVFPTKIISQGKAKHFGTFSLYVNLSYETMKKKNYTVASLVLNSFRRPTQYCNSTHHINFCSYDNRLENLCFENFRNKRKMEYVNGVRDGTKNTRHWVESGHIAKGKNNFTHISHNPHGTKGKIFQVARKKFPITIYFKSSNSVQTFSSIRNAVLLTGIKEYSIRNAMDRPHKYIRFSIKKGIMDLQEFMQVA